MMDNDLNKIKDKIWWTKKARIYAENRLNSNSKISQYLLIWYSFLVVCTSIYGWKYNLPDYIQLALIFLSIGILVISVIVNYSRFPERAMEMKRSHEMLNKLHDDASGLKLSDLNEQYARILELSDNHLDIDYLSALVSEYENLHESEKDPEGENYPLSNTPSQFQIDQHHNHKCLNNSLNVFYWLLPFALLIPIHFLLR